LEKLIEDKENLNEMCITCALWLVKLILNSGVFNIERMYI